MKIYSTILKRPELGQCYCPCCKSRSEKEKERNKKKARQEERKIIEEQLDELGEIE